VTADFTPLSALAGGILIGLGTALLLVVNGRTAGVSGMLAGIAGPVRGDVLWRALFLFGLLAAGVLASAFEPSLLAPSPRSTGVLALGGLLVGFGTRLSRGCTSGHGVCGLARGSFRSLAATATFMLAAIATVALLRLTGVIP
jgi:uncharacterized membrane protein YedE/YeeE